MLLLIGFIGSLVITFSLVIAIARPSSDQRALAQRIFAIKAPSSALTLEGQSMQLLKTQEHSSFAWLESMLDRFHFSEALRQYILQANSKTTAAKLILSSVVLGAVCAFVSYFFAPLMLVQLVAACAGGAIPIGLLSFKRSRRLAAFNTALPEAIDLMARALRAGHSMVSAIGLLAEEAPEAARPQFGEVFRQQNFGLGLRDALMQLLERVPSEDLRVLVTGILVQKETGGNLAEILDRIVKVIRERQRIRGEIRVHTAQGRLTGWILCLLPVVLLFIINIINPGYSKVLLETKVGHQMIYAGLMLLAVGGFLIRRIINGIEV